MLMSKTMLRIPESRFFLGSKAKFQFQDLQSTMVEINHLTLTNLMNGNHGRTGRHKGHAGLDLRQDEAATENERGAYRLGPACLASRDLQTMVIFWATSWIRTSITMN